MWTSTNPWKVTSLFNSVSETRADYLAAIDTLRDSAPPEIEFTSETEVSGKRPHRDISHWQLIFALELRVDVIDQELKVRSPFGHELFTSLTLLSGWRKHGRNKLKNSLMFNILQSWRKWMNLHLQQVPKTH